MPANFTHPENHYPGLVTAFSDAHITHIEDIQADLEGEQETLPDLAEDDFTPVPINDDSPNQPGETVLPPEWTKTVAGASKGVTDGTEGEYLRYGAHLHAFALHSHGLLIDYPSNVSAFS